MDWLEQNLDAYRIIAEILTELRQILRVQLEALHGGSWHDTGFPPGLLDSLVEIKEKEKAIDWYESEYQQIMDYAVFPDLLKILEHNSDAFPQIMRLAPTAALLHARFLELEVMRAKLGRARPISETELAFLGTFHLRFRKAIEDFKAHPPAQQPAPAPKPEPIQPEQVEPEEIEDEREAPEPAPYREPPAAPSPPRRRASPAPAPANPAPAATPAAASSDAKHRGKAAKVMEASPADDAGDDRAEDDDAAIAGPSIDDLLKGSDDIGILRELYREVTHTAERIWTSDALPSTRIWNKVSASDWYESNFSRLGLKPVSDFYEIISKVDRQIRDGVVKAELQAYLKKSNFAQVLLALRDMFQRNQI